MPRFHHAHCSLVNLGVTEDFLDGLEGAAEEVLAKLLNMSMGDGGVKVDTLISMEVWVADERVWRVCLACSQVVQRWQMAQVLEEI